MRHLFGILSLLLVPSFTLARGKNSFYYHLSASIGAFQLNLEPETSPNDATDIKALGLRFGGYVSSTFEMNLGGTFGTTDAIATTTADQENLVSIPLSGKKILKLGLGFNYLSIKSDQPYSFNQIVGIQGLMKFYPSNRWLFQYSGGPMLNSQDVKAGNLFHRAGISLKVIDNQQPWWLTIEGSYLNFYSGANNNRTIRKTALAVITYGFL